MNTTSAICPNLIFSSGYRYCIYVNEYVYYIGQNKPEDLGYITHVKKLSYKICTIT